MKRNSVRRVLALLLTVCLTVGLFPAMPARALLEREGEYNPNTGEVIIDLDLQYTQEVSVEALVDGDHFGWLYKNEELIGYDGALESADSCKANYSVYPASDESYSAGIATNKEVRVLPKSGSADNGHYYIYWTGSINGKPAVGQNPDNDKYTLTILVRPQGLPDRGRTECHEETTTDEEGNSTTETIHEEDWIWPQQYASKLNLTLDYANIITDSGNGNAQASGLQIALANGVSNEQIMALLWDFPGMSKRLEAEKITQKTSSSDPVNMISGSYYFSYTDLRLEGAFPLSFRRSYSSRNQSSGGMGKGFTHSFDYHLKYDNGYVHVSLPGGEELIFLRLRDFEDEDFYSVQNVQFKLEDASGGGYTMSYKDGTRWSFAADGKLTQVTTPQGKTAYTFSYSENKLTTIDGLAGSMSLTWDGGHITAVTDSAGRQVRYAYTGNLLTSVTNPDGDALSYTYDANGYIATTSDFTGKIYVQNTYDSIGRVTHQVFTNADVETENRFSYDDENLVNTYTDPSGQQTKYYYDKYRNLLKTETKDGVTSSGYTNHIASEKKDNQGKKTTHAIDDAGNITQITYPDGGGMFISYTASNQINSISHIGGGTEWYAYDSSNNLTQYTDPRGNSTQYTYNENGLQASETDAAGNTTTYNYDDAGRLLSVTDAQGGVTSYTYDAVGRIASATVKLTHETSATTQYEYTNAGKLSKVIDALGGETVYTYNANGFTTSTTDALNRTTSTQYGTNGQPVKQTDANGNETLYAYEAETGLLKSITDPEGNVTAYSYDDSGRITSTVDAAGNETKYEYDSLGRMVKTIDALGGTTSYEYDSMDRTASTTDANGNQTIYTYDKLGRTAKTTDAEGNETCYLYDHNGNLLQTTDANGNATSTEYNALNYTVKSIDAQGNATTYEYDKVGRMVKVTDALLGETAFTYDLAGNLLSTTDPNGSMTQYVYDLLGRTVEQISADNSTVKYTYDAMGNVLERFNELNEKTTYTYDANGNQLSVTDPMSNVTTYAYNKNNQVTAITYADGGVVRYTYSPLGSVTTQTDQNGNVISCAYDALGRQTTVTDGNGIVTEYFYDAVGNTLQTKRDGKPVSQTTYDKLNRAKTAADALGNTASNAYDGVGNITAYTDREGNVTEYSYNKNYQLTQTKDAMGYTQLTEYDALGRAVKTTNQNGQSTLTAYDANGNTVSITDALGGTISYSYDAMNRVVSSTDQLGATTTYSYDAAGKLLKTTDALNAYSVNEYDANGNLIQYTNKANEWVKYEYDSMNRLVKETNQLNHAAAYEYDLVGNRLAVIDGNKNRTEYTYDGLNQLISTTNAEGSVTAYAYHYLGSVTSMTTDAADGQRAVTAYEYDLAGNLTKETSPLGNTTAYVYDKEANVTRKTDENNAVTTYGYDKLYRLTSRTDTDGTASYTYDGLSNMLTATDGSGAVTFAYDALSRTTQVTNEDSSITGYTYNAAGKRLSISYPDGNAVHTAYDALGNVSALTDYDGTGITYTRDAEGRTTKEAHSDGSTTEYDYNSAGLMIQQKEVKADNTTRREILYGYDDAGNLKSEQRSGVDVDKKDENVRYYYDKANQLVKTTVEGVTQNYTYDLAGNLLSDGEYTYAYDLQNRLLTKAGSDGTTTYAYDAAGNLVKEASPDGSVSYTYNAQNKLVKGETDDGRSSSYTYNALGVRIQNVQVRENRNSGYQNAPLTNGSRFMKDYMSALTDFRATWQRVWETEVGTVVQNDCETVTKRYTVDYLSIANRDIMVTEDGSFVQRYVYDESGRRISAEFNDADGTARGTANANGEYGENPASDIAVNDIGKVWYRTSLLNSTLFAVDANGAVVAHMIYDPWGNPLTETYIDTNRSGLDNLNNYTGYSWDETLELYYAQNRFYAPDNYRFTQEDIVKDGGNWYVYCHNSPTNLTDPTGTVAMVDDVIIICAAGGAIITMAYAEWVIWVNSPEGQKVIARATQVICNGVAYLGNAIRTLANQTLTGIAAVGDAVVDAAKDAALWIGKQVSGIWESITSYSEKVACDHALKKAVNNIDANKKNHILDSKHNWSNLLPNPNDPNHWQKIAAIITQVLNQGAEKLYKNGPAYIKSLEVDGKIVEVVYRIMDGVVKIADAWVK